MQDQPTTMQARASAATATIAAMEQQLQETQADLRKLPFFARAFVERDFSSSTGRSFADWLSAAARLRGALTPLTTGPAPAGADPARRAIQDELPQLAKLRAYMTKAPEKVNMVPGGMLKPQQRQSFLEHVEQQARAIQTLEGELAEIATLLSGAR